MLGALALVVASTGCQSEEGECTTSFDCQDTPERRNPANPYVCQENRCVQLSETRPPGPGTDAGTDGGTGGGTDAGVDPCQLAPHDAKLGTLELQSGFEATESTALPGGIIAVTAVGPGPTYTLYGLHGGDKSLYPLGTWPSLSANAALFSVIEPADRGQNVFLNTSLVNDGTRLLSGYTKPGTNFPGFLALAKPTPPASLRYVTAPGNFTAAALPGTFLINGLGLEGKNDGAAIYALKVEPEPPTSSLLATFDPAWSASSGLTAVTAHGVAVLGYFDGVNFINRLRAAPPSLYQPALTSGTPFSLADATEVPLDSDIFNVAAFGDGVAVLRGNYDSTFTPVYIDVARVGLTLGAGDPQTVTPEALAPILKFADTCTSVEMLSPLGGDLLVGVTDKNGRRLVRLHLP